MVGLSPDQTKKFWKVGLMSLVGFMVVCVWVLYSIPSIVKFKPKDEGSEGGSDSGMCVQEIYDGVCREHLLVFQSCKSNSSQNEGSAGEGVVYIPASRASQERSAQIVIPSLGILMPSAECELELASLLCLNLFGVCTDGGEVVRPSSGQCERLRTEVCVSEWETAAELIRSFQAELSSLEGFNLEFPNCASLPNETACDVSNVNSSQRVTPVSANSSNDTLLAKQKCSQGFYVNDFGFCQPVCGEWKQYSAKATVAVDTIVILSCSIFLIATFVAMVLSCVQYKRMMKVPGVLAVYQLGSASMIPLVWLVSYSGQNELFCSSDDYGLSVQNPTEFCYISGFVQFYTPLHTTALWLSQILVILWGTVYPFHAQRTLQHHGWSLHLVLLLVSSIPPAIVAAGTFGIGDYVTRFPPVLCTSEDPVATYYFLVLPLTITCATGVSALVIILTQLVRRRKSSQRSYTTAELKILISLLYYVILTIVAITSYSVILRNFDKFEEELFKYFTCESTGIVDGESCSRSGFESVDSTSISLPVIAVLFAIYPFILLIYIVNVEEIRHFFMVVIMKYSVIGRKNSNKSSSSATFSHQTSVVAGSHQGHSQTGASDMEQTAAMETCDTVDGGELGMEVVGYSGTNGPDAMPSAIGLVQQ